MTTLATALQKTLDGRWAAIRDESGAAMPRSLIHI